MGKTATLLQLSVYFGCKTKASCLCWRDAEPVQPQKYDPRSSEQSRGCPAEAPAKHPATPKVRTAARLLGRLLLKWRGI